MIGRALCPVRSAKSAQTPLVTKLGIARISLVLDTRPQLYIWQLARTGTSKRTLATTLMCSIWISNQATHQKKCISQCMEEYDPYFHIQTRDPFSQSIFPRAECPRQSSEDSTGHAA